MGMMVFDFESNAVRAFMRDGQDWFVSVDVCRCLGLENSRQAMSRLPDDEKGVTVNDTLGGPQEMACVNEPGLYRLIFTSTKPEAERLKRFVFHDVLPQLRRTGAYSPAPDWDEIKEKRLLVDTAHRVLGRKAGAALYRDLGLPIADEPHEPVQEREGAFGHVLDFIDECVVHDKSCEVAALAIYQRYQQWSSTSSAPYIIQSVFGKFLVRAGLKRRKSNGNIYTGVRIRHSVEIAAS